MVKLRNVKVGTIEPKFQLSIKYQPIFGIWDLY